MQPIIATKGKVTHLRYELSQRAHASTVYPVKAPNGSTIVLCGSENGLAILWRGGRPLKQSAPAPNAPAKAPPKVNGTKDVVMIIDSGDDEPAKATLQPLPNAEFEEEEEEVDPGRPYPSIIQHLRLPLNTEVLHIAVPQVPAPSELQPGQVIPSIFKEKLVIAVACTDFTVRIITLPLSPPPHGVKERPSTGKSLFGEEVVKIPTYAGHQTIPSGVSVTWTSSAEQGHGAPLEDEMEVEDNNATASSRRSPRKRQAPPQLVTEKDPKGFDLLVASHSAELGGLLKIWRFGLTGSSVKTTNPISAYHTVILPKPAVKIAFNTAPYPKRRHCQLLIADSAGVARIYDPFAPRKRNNASGAFVALFKTRFENVKPSVPSAPTLASRKPILDATWVSEGHSILALLADGEWGIWDVKNASSKSSGDPSAFSLRSFVGTSESDKSSSGASSPKSRSGRSSLVPMTPNTRRRTQEVLFQGNPSSAISTRGGISLASLASSNGDPALESVVIWYGKDLYRLTDLAKYRARAASSIPGSSLPGPGLAQVHDVPLLGESITSVSQFNITKREARMAVSRDLLISAEYRLIISTSTNQPSDQDAMTASAKEDMEEADNRRTDQALLARGELSLEGMSRLLDNMSGNGPHNVLTLGNPRKLDQLAVQLGPAHMAQVLPAKRPHGLSHRHQVSVDSIAPRRKRTRLSNEPSLEPSETFYAQDAVSDAPTDEPSSAESDPEEDEARFFRATQIVERSLRKATHGDNTPAEHGIIEEIGCINFMCHEQLTVKLGPLINFIIGHNGSGKSAVLTALTLCLGGKAAATNRGQSLKSFIKAGKDWSTLSVKIKNQGLGAYKPDQFGDSIIVERHFTQNSTSGFKLKDRNGRVVSTKKSELEDIIDHFGLQIDNPMNVLTQDMARQFLNDSNPKEKYKFFLKGTQLEALDRDYSQIQQELEEQMAKHQTLYKDVKELEKIYSRLEKKAQAARGLEKLRAEETKLERQAAWSFVANTELELADCETKISELSNTVQQRQADADTASERFARHDKAVNDATMAVEACQAELQPARDEEKEANANFADARKKLIDFKNNERSVVGAINKTKRSMQDTQSQINEQKARRALADGGLYQQKARELEDAKAAYEERKAAWENHDQALPALNKDSQDAKEHLKRTTALLEDKKREESQFREKIRRLEQGQGNWFDSYRNGHNLEKLIRAIRDARGFHAQPVGPIGRYVELRHPRWSSILEQQLGGVLNAFVVTNKADHGRLSELMRKFN
ncbi:hypothetical protein SLS60_006080 [Paraconiothyrium brasiliense]|uniref:Rad50/SbcC-type AAA domain-containing protein n=1 Tax=Paraconiothyrium brasiliense TaxID=300254 RepID=A0ABR3RE06_9PLEO